MTPESKALVITRERDRGVKFVFNAAIEAARIPHFWSGLREEEKMIPLIKEKLGNQMAMISINAAAARAKDK